MFDNQEETVNWIAVESLGRQSTGLLIDLFLMSLTRRSSRFVHVQIPASTGRERVIRNDNETLIGRRLASTTFESKYIEGLFFLEDDFSRFFFIEFYENTESKIRCYEQLCNYIHHVLRESQMFARGIDYFFLNLLHVFLICLVSIFSINQPSKTHSFRSNIIFYVKL